MSGIVLSASVRQNLLSLQSTAALLATTQNDLATGNKVNSALDNPTEFFTAQGLNNRASDIGNLLDGISNGVQVLQAANTGITSLQGYISTAQSIANQVLQAPTGYSTKSSITTTAITGATADNLLGTYAAGVNAAATGTTPLAAIDLTGTPAANAVITGGSALGPIDLTGTPATNAVDTGTAALGTIDLTSPTTTAATVSSTTAYSAFDLSSSTFTLGLSIDGHAVSVSVDNSLTAVDKTAVTGDELATAINAQINTSLGTTNASYVSFDSGTNEFSVSSQTQGTTGSVQITAVGGTAIVGSSGFVVGGSATTGTSTPAANLTFDVNSQHVTLTAGSNYTAQQVADQINQQAGTLGDVNATVDTNGKLVLTSTSTTLGTADSVTVDNFSAGSDASTLGFAAGSSSTQTGHALVAGQDLTFNINNQTVTLAAGSSYTGQQIADKINTDVGTSAAVHATINTSGALVLTSTGTASSTDEVKVDTFSGSGDGTQLGLTAAPDAHGTAAAPAAARTFDVNGQHVTLASGTDYTAAGIVSAINQQVGTSASVKATLDSTGNLVVTSTGTANAQDTLTIDNFSTGTDASELGYAAGPSVTEGGADPATSPIKGLELTIAATGNGTATDITFGTGDGQISTLNQLNAALSANNLQASIDSTSGAITITTTNNAASSTIGLVGGTAAGTGDIFAAYNGVTGPAPVADPNSQATRASLVAQYNQTLQQINTTAQDSSFNGINLLNGDTLNLTFDETGASKLSVTGVTFNTAGLGLSSLTAGSAFLDSNSANVVLSQLTQASTTLRTEASSLGSNLSVVQNRQDFNKSLINVLQTGASNLTLADPNEEAANSQALSTRQSIAVSALALANQSQQSVLQLLR